MLITNISGVFDKIARLLQLPHSPDRGLGPVLEEYAAAEALPPYDKTPMQPLPRPLSRGPEKATLSFSYAGLLTATDRAAQRECPNLKGEVPLAVQREVARVFQVAAVRHTVDKIRQCIDANKLEIKGLVVSGGVGSNQYLRQE
jgi:tRNA A37 threonylcarbamoyltransferase TsaD